MFHNPSGQQKQAKIQKATNPASTRIISTFAAQQQSGLSLCSGLFVTGRKVGTTQGAILPNGKVPGREQPGNSEYHRK